MRGTGTAQPYEVSELGIGAADQPPTLAPLYERLDDRPAVRWSLLLLRALGSIAIAGMVGFAAGGIAVILQRAAS